MRLDKYLCDSLLGTRSEVKAKIKKNLCKINDTIIKDPGYQIDPQKDIVFFDNIQVHYCEYRYYLLNKPSGYITATHDSTEKTVLDLLPSNLRKDISPVGRLDKDTEGLLLLTNDGELSHRLLSPKYHVDKSYYVKLDKEIDINKLKSFKTGIDIGDDKPTEPAIYEIIDSKTVILTIHEGRFHQVKRMFEAIDNLVVYLNRISFGPLFLKDFDIKTGEYMELSSNEIQLLKEFKYVKTGN